MLKVVLIKHLNPNHCNIAPKTGCHQNRLLVTFFFEILFNRRQEIYLLWKDFNLEKYIVYGV
jgi:hypothetical protein